jgi:hypothetical protein
MEFLDQLNLHQLLEEDLRYGVGTNGRLILIMELFIMLSCSEEYGPCRVQNMRNCTTKW